MKYQYISIQNKWMRVAYDKAKQLYLLKRWNLKTTPICVIVNNNNHMISIAACANGTHPLIGKCDRLAEAKTAYSNCKFCQYDQHAEYLALKNIPEWVNLKHARMYLYGHYRVCSHCQKALQDRGINKYYLLKDSHILFDRHNPKTVVGTRQQFNI